MWKKRVFAGITAFLCLLLLCAPLASALSLAVYHLETLEEYEAELAKNNLPGDYVTYDMVKMVGAFDSLYLGTSSKIGGNFQSIYLNMTDGSGYPVSLQMVRKSAQEYAGRIEDYGNYCGEVNSKDLRTTKTNQDGYSVYSLGEVSYIYFCDQLIYITWWYNGRMYYLQSDGFYGERLWNYPQDVSNTFLSRMLNVSTAEAAFGELMTSVKQGQAVLRRNQFRRELPWALAGGAVLAGMIFFVRWRKKRELLEEIEEEEAVVK